MTKNTMSDLNNHLFEQLERLNDLELSGPKLEEEMKRAKAITSVASRIIQNGELVLKASLAADEFLDADRKTPKMLNG